LLLGASQLAAVASNVTTALPEAIFTIDDEEDFTASAKCLVPLQTLAWFSLVLYLLLHIS
jgi:formaldehyde-activating enzyme involved in methanogenesis